MAGGQSAPRLARGAILFSLLVGSGCADKAPTQVQRRDEVKSGEVPNASDEVKNGAVGDASETAPLFELMFLEPDSLIARYNGRIQSAKDTGKATKEYWLEIALDSIMRYRMLEYYTEHPNDAAKMFGVSLRTDQSKFILALVLANLMEGREARVIAGLDVSQIDKDAVDCGANYAAWLQKDAAQKGRLADLYARQINVANELPQALTESLVRYAMGDINFSSASQNQREKAGRGSEELNAISSTGKLLDDSRAELTAQCIRVRALLSSRYGGEFQVISIP